MKRGAPTLANIVEADQGPFKTIGQIADELKISHRTIRFYEQMGLIKPVRENNKRLFLKIHREQIANILRYQQAGMSLRKIKDICEGEGSSIDKSGEFTSCELSSMIERLRVRRDEINMAIQEFEAILEKTVSVAQPAARDLRA